MGFTSELLFSEESNLNPAAFMCYANSGAEKSDHRICHNGIAAAVSSILVCMMLLIFDTFIPCLNKMVCLECMHVIRYNRLGKTLTI